MPKKSRSFWIKWAFSALFFALGSCQSVDLSGGQDLSSSSQASSSSSVLNDWIQVRGDTLLWDGRSQRSYRLVRAGAVLWMRESLSYGDSVARASVPVSPSRVEGYCPSASPCNYYLYPWLEILNFKSACLNRLCLDTLGADLQGPCPQGWVLPKEKDWADLAQYLLKDPFWASDFRNKSGEIFFSLSEADSQKIWTWAFYSEGLSTRTLISKNGNFAVRCIQRSAP